MCKPFDYAPNRHTYAHRYIVSVSVYRGELIKNSIIEIANNNRLKVTRLRNVGNVFYTLCLPLPVSTIPVPSPPSLLPSFAVFPFVMNMSRHFVDCITIELRLVIFIGTSLD